MAAERRPVFRSDAKSLLLTIAAQFASTDQVDMAMRNNATGACKATDGRTDDVSL